MQQNFYDNISTSSSVLAHKGHKIKYSYWPKMNVDVLCIKVKECLCMYHN